MAFIAYYLHWSYEDVMRMEHHERRRWCKEISNVNREVSGEPENMFARYMR